MRKGDFAVGLEVPNEVGQGGDATFVLGLVTSLLGGRLVVRAGMLFALGFGHDGRFTGAWVEAELGRECGRFGGEFDTSGKTGG